MDTQKYDRFLTKHKIDRQAIFALCVSHQNKWTLEEIQSLIDTPITHWRYMAEHVGHIDKTLINPNSSAKYYDIYDIAKLLLKYKKDNVSIHQKMKGLRQHKYVVFAFEIRKHFGIPNTGEKDKRRHKVIGVRLKVGIMRNKRIVYKDVLSLSNEYLKEIKVNDDRIIDLYEYNSFNAMTRDYPEFRKRKGILKNIVRNHI